MPTNDDERLLRAAKYGDFGIVEDMYRRYPTNHFSNPKRFKNSVTPLHAACLSGKSPMGADPNALDAWHCTPLHNAAAGSGSPILPEITTAKGLDAIELARSMNKYETLRVMSNWKEPPALEEAKVAYQQ
ncbi:Tankyrase_ TRF1interacting ankyrinrelated ADPribose polymerase 2, partial [Caligus rogercresseyi]